MACKPVCRLCDRLVISAAVTFTGGNLVVNLPAGSYIITRYSGEFTRIRINITRV